MQLERNQTRIETLARHNINERRGVSQPVNKLDKLTDNTPVSTNRDD
jgi:hypothetical protein